MLMLEMEARSPPDPPGLLSPPLLKESALLQDELGCALEQG